MTVIRDRSTEIKAPKPRLARTVFPPDADFVAEAVADSVNVDVTSALPTVATELAPTVELVLLTDTLVLIPLSVPDVAVGGPETEVTLTVAVGISLIGVHSAEMFPPTPPKVEGVRSVAFTGGRQTPSISTPQTDLGENKHMKKSLKP